MAETPPLVSLPFLQGRKKLPRSSSRPSGAREIYFSPSSRPSSSSCVFVAVSGGGRAAFSGAAYGLLQSNYIPYSASAPVSGA